MLPSFLFGNEGVSGFATERAVGQKKTGTTGEWVDFPFTNRVLFSFFLGPIAKDAPVVSELFRRPHCPELSQEVGDETGVQQWVVQQSTAWFEDTRVFKSKNHKLSKAASIKTVKKHTKCYSNPFKHQQNTNKTSMKDRLKHPNPRCFAASARRCRRSPRSGSRGRDSEKFSQVAGPWTRKFPRNVFWVRKVLIL